MQKVPKESAPVDVPLGQLAWTFFVLGIATFGGNVQSWIFREVVVRRKWMEEEAFLSGVGLATVLPGANPVNIAVYVGLQLRGGIGAAAATISMLLPSFAIILILGALYHNFQHYPVLNFVLGGLAAAAIGASANMGLKLAQQLPRDILALGIAAGVFFASAILRAPMIWIVAAAIPPSLVRLYFWTRKNNG
jgi:chromate transporter